MLFDRFGANLPDGGSNIKMNIEGIKKRMVHLRGYVPSSGEIIEMLRQPEDPKQYTPASGNAGQPTNAAQPGLKKVHICTCIVMYCISLNNSWMQMNAFVAVKLKYKCANL